MYIKKPGVLIARFVAVIIFITASAFAKTTIKKPSLACLMACDNHDPLSYRDWQYSKTMFNSKKPKKENVINCFNPAVLCKISCKDIKGSTASWWPKNDKKATKLEVEDLRLTGKRCFIKLSLPILLKTKVSVMRMTPILRGEGVIHLNVAGSKNSYYYKAKTGE